MKIKDFVSAFDTLNEVAMNPNSLKKLASQINAYAGMEFEMIVPGVTTNSEEEPDFDLDEPIRSIDDIREFFYENDTTGNNNEHDVERAMESLTQDYLEWRSNKINEEWTTGSGRDFFEEYIEDYFDEEEALSNAKEFYGNDDEKIQAAVEEAKQEFFNNEWEDEGRLYDRARNAYFELEEESDSDVYSQYKFLKDQGYRTMLDIYNNLGNLYWPYVTNNNESNFEEIAESFRNAIGRRVITSDDYHSPNVNRNTDAYIIEPDSSIDVDDESNEGGLEFVSPPLPLSEMLADLADVIAWAKKHNCYTNTSTGLHMNVSVPNYNVENLDYVKLSILIGDSYVLQQYGREFNTYCQSALTNVRQNISRKSNDAEYVMNVMRQGLNVTASKMIHSELTSKYTSINIKKNYVEFRSPGGDWLNEDLNKLSSTLMRFVVALEASLDPEKYRKEYLKKLYKMLAPNSRTDVIAYFANYVAGFIDKNALIYYIRQQQEQRKLSKLKRYWIELNNYSNGREVYANNEQEALKKYKVMDKDEDWSNFPDFDFRIQELEPIKNR